MGELFNTNINHDLRAYLLENLGLNFSERQEDELIRKIGFASEYFGYKNTITFIKWLLNTKLTKEETSLLASHLTIGETYFMREKKGFDFLEYIYLPGLIHKRLAVKKKLKVWCAGCATGEEAYSLAIVLKQSLPFIKDWNIELIATDINREFIDKAKKGVYTKWSFRNNSEEFKNKYFSLIGKGVYEIIPEIKKMVTFSYLNLAKEEYTSERNNINDFDIVFCRNVLIYFSNEGIRSVTERLYHSLMDGGVMVVSPVEMSNLICRKFDTIHYSGYTIYHKGKIKSNKKDIKNTSGSSENQVERVEKISQNRQKSKPLNIPRKKEIPIPPKPIVAKKVEKVDERAKLQVDFEKIELLYGKGAFEETETLLENYLSQSITHNESAINIMAKTKANLGKLKEAETWCIKGLAINKLNPNLHYLLATILQESGNDEKAMAELKMSLYLDSDFVLAHFLLGTLLSKNGNTMAGNKAYKNALLSLSKYAQEDILPESDGITAGRFSSIINSITN